MPDHLTATKKTINFLRRHALHLAVKHWTLATLREMLIRIGAKAVRHAKYMKFQLAEVAAPRRLFAAVLERIGRLREAAAGLIPWGWFDEPFKLAPAVILQGDAVRP